MWLPGTSTASAYGAMSSRMVEGNVLFNDALNTFYLRLYGVGHLMVKYHSDGERKPAAATIWAALSD